MSITMVEVTLTSKGEGILFNPMTQDILEELAGIRAKAPPDKDLSLEERARRKIPREGNRPDGNMGLPGTYILGTLNAAGRFVKNGKEKISTKTSTTLFEFLNLEQELFPFQEQGDSEWRTCAEGWLW